MSSSHPSLPRTTEAQRHGEYGRQLRLRVSVSLWFVIVFAVAANVAALTVLPADFNEMVAGSELIVHGRVTDVRSQMTGGRRSIESIVTVAVIDSLKGAPGREVVFRVPSGQVGRYRRVLVGSPEFAPGQEVVLFLSGRAPALPMPFGLAQGVYRVGRAADGAAMVASLPVTEFARKVRTAAEARR